MGGDAAHLGRAEQPHAGGGGSVQDHRDQQVHLEGLCMYVLQSSGTLYIPLSLFLQTILPVSSAVRRPRSGGKTAGCSTTSPWVTSGMGSDGSTTAGGGTTAGSTLEMVWRPAPLMPSLPVCYRVTHSIITDRVASQEMAFVKWKAVKITSSMTWIPITLKQV